MPASTRPSTPARAKLDSNAAAAVDLARAAAEEAAGPGGVGEHLGVTAEGERIVTHRFAAVEPGYRKWAWSVVLARVPRARSATVSEVVLMPTDDALLAPPWVPWADRLEPGDLGESDLLPFRDQDPLLDEGHEALERLPDLLGEGGLAETDAALLWELGLGRTRVLNREGRSEAAARWYRGPEGPGSPAARAATSACGSCGYLVGLRGSLRAQFGVCANAWSPDDGKVVSLDHGCGAHSETGREAEDTTVIADPLIDDLRAQYDLEELPPGATTEPADQVTAATAHPVEETSPASGAADGQSPDPLDPPSDSSEGDDAPGAPDDIDAAPAS